MNRRFFYSLIPPYLALDNDTKSVDSKTSVASANAGGGGGGGGIGFFAKKRAAALSQESGKKDIPASSSTANNAMDSANHANTNSANNNANAHDYASQSVANLSQFDTALLSESKNGDDASFATANGGEDTETLEDRDEVPQSISANADAVDDDLTVGTVNTETLNAAYDMDLDQATNNRFEDGQLKHSPTGNAVTGASNENGTNSDNLEVLANVAGQKSPNRNESCSPTNSADTAHVENVSRPIVAKPSNPAVLTSPRFNNQDIIAADSHKTHARGNATVQSYGSDRRVSRNSPVPKPTFGSNGVASRNSPVPMAASGNNGVASRNSPVPKSVSGSTPLNQHNSPVPNVGKMNSEGPRPYSMVRLGVESVKNTFASNQSPKNNSGTNIVANPGQPTDNSRVLPLPDALVHRNSPVPTDSKANYDISNPHPTVRLGVETENTAFTSAQSPKQFEGANNMPSPVPTQNSRVLPIPAKCTNAAPQAAPTAKSSYFPGATVDEKAITHSVNSIASQHQSNVAVNHSYSTSGAESGDKGNFAVPAPRFGIKGPVNLAHSNFRPNMSAVNTRRDSVDESTEIVLPTAIAKTPGNRPRQSIVTPSSHNDTQSGDIAGIDNCRINAVTPTPRKGPNPASSTQYDTSPYDRVVPGITPTHNMQKKPKNMSTMHDLAQETSVPPRQLAPGKPSQSVLSPAPVLVRESATPKTSNVTEPNPSQWNTSAFSDSACASDTFDELLAQFQEDLQEGTDYYDKGENDLLKLEVDLSHALAAALRYKGEMMDLLDDIEGVKAMADGMLAEVAE